MWHRQRRRFYDTFETNSKATNMCVCGVCHGNDCKKENRKATDKNANQIDMKNFTPQWRVETIAVHFEFHVNIFSVFFFVSAFRLVMRAIRMYYTYVLIWLLHLTIHIPRYCHQWDWHCKWAGCVAHAMCVPCLRSVYPCAVQFRYQIKIEISSHLSITIIITSLSSSETASIQHTQPILKRKKDAECRNETKSIRWFTKTTSEIALRKTDGNRWKKIQLKFMRMLCHIVRAVRISAAWKWQSNLCLTNTTVRSNRVHTFNPHRQTIRYLNITPILCVSGVWRWRPATQQTQCEL